MLKRLKDIPRYGWICGFLYFGLQYGMYRLGDWLSRIIGTIDRAFLPKIPFLDDRVPVIAVFAIIYLYSYFFWICGPIAASLTGKKNFVNYLIGLSAAYLIGFLIFVFFPSYMDRSAEGLMELAAQPDFRGRILSLIYEADGSTMGFNLFPSYHCLISVYCYFGVRRRPQIAKWFRVYSAVMTVLICLSTVFTKQHYLIDIAGGLGISVLCYAIVERVDPAGKLLHIPDGEKTP